LSTGIAPSGTETKRPVAGSGIRSISTSADLTILVPTVATPGSLAIRSATLRGALSTPTNTSAKR